MPGPETIAAAIAAARARLVTADVPDAATDARLLMQHVLACDHAGLILAGERSLTDAERAAFEALLSRRLAHEPVSKILGEREFYGRLFHVTADVLDPRADTETLIEVALEQPARRVLDLGSGSGALIVTLLAEWPEATGVAVDLSEKALAVTAENARRLGVAERLALLQGEWFGPVSGQFDLIVSNPPYIPSAEIDGLEPDVREHDPLLALDGGADGLSCYRAIAGAAAPHLAPEGRIIVEIGAGQGPDVARIFAAAGFRQAAERRDLGGHVRALLFTFPA